MTRLLYAIEIVPDPTDDPDRKYYHAQPDRYAGAKLYTDNSVTIPVSTVPSGDEPGTGATQPVTQPFHPTRTGRDDDPTDDAEPHASSDQGTDDYTMVIIPVLRPGVAKATYHEIDEPTLAGPDAVAIATRLLYDATIATTPTDAPHAKLPIATTDELFEQLPTTISEL